MTSPKPTDLLTLKDYRLLTSSLIDGVPGYDRTEVRKNFYRIHPSDTPLHPETVEEITVNATNENPVTISGVPLTGVIDYGTLDTVWLVDTTKLEPGHPTRASRHIFTEPATFKHYYTVEGIRKLNNEKMKTQDLKTAYTEYVATDRSAYHHGIPQEDLDNFIAHALNPRYYVGEIPEGWEPPVVEKGLEGIMRPGALVYKSNIQLGNMLVGRARTLTRAHELTRQFLEESKVSPSKRALDLKGEERYTLYTEQQAKLIRRWNMAKGDDKQACIKEAKLHFPANAPHEELYMLPPRIKRMLGNASVTVLRTTLKKHRPVGAVAPYGSKRDSSTELSLKDMLFKQEDAEAIMEAVKNLSKSQ